jgi:hypothetical protein
MKTGRKPARFTHASFQRSHIMRAALAALGAPPATSPDWVTAVTKQTPSGWLMDGNDTYGDCVIADCAHQEMLRTANVGTIWTPALIDVLGLYAYFQGYKGDMTNLADIQAYLKNNDNGCDELTVINYLTQNGWLGRKLDGHANLDPAQLDQIKWAVCIFGASRLGINLPDSAMAQFNGGEPWTPVANSQLDGGHDVPVVKYDGNWFYVVTWGKLQPVSPAFLTAKYPDGTPYLEEAHAELAFDWVNAAGTCPANLNLTQLLADLASVVEPPSPTPTPPPNPPPPTPQPPISKLEFFRLVNFANHADYNDPRMNSVDAAQDIAGICKQVTG